MRSSVEVGAARAGHARRLPRVEQLGDRRERGGHRVEVDGHHPREHVLGDARHRRAPRAPASLARLRAGVWLSDRLVGAMNTSQAASAAAIGRGGSVPSVARSSIIASTASAPRLRGLLAQRLADRARAGVDDHQHVLARLDRQAAVDDRADGGARSGMRRIICRGGDRAAARPLRQRAVARAPAPSDARLAALAGVAQSVRAAES